MKIAFTGNGVRIRNILKCLMWFSCCLLHVYHVQSGQSFYSSTSSRVLDFIFKHGCADDYCLFIEPVDEKEYY